MVSGSVHPRKNGYGPLTVFALGLFLLILSVYHHGTEISAINDVLDPFLAFLTDGAPALGLVYFGYWLGGTDLFRVKKRDVALWTVGGLIVLGGITLIEVAIKLNEGRAVSEPAYTFLVAANYGALAGFIAGYFKSKADYERTVINDTKERMEFTLKETDTGLWVWNMDTGEMEWDPTMFEVLEIEEEDFNGTFEEFLGYVNPEDRDELRETINAALDNGGLVQCEHRIQKGDGEEIWVDTRGEQYSEKGEEKLVGILTDVTEQKEHQNRLELKRKRLQSMFRRAADPILVLDESGEIVDCNDLTLEKLGYNMDELIGMSVWDVEAAISREAIEDFMEKIDEEGEGGPVEGEHRRKDGTKYPVEVLVRRFEIQGGKRFICNARDITERKEKERELKHAKERLDLALEGTGTGVWEWNISDGEVIWDETMEGIFGLEPGEFGGTFEEFEEFVHPDDVSYVEEELEKVLEEDEIFDVEYRVNTAAGNIIWVKARGEVYEDDRGQYMVGIVSDITELKEREKELEASNEKLEQFAYVASHDLQEPLRTISNYVEILVDDYGDDLDEDADRFIDVIVTASERLQSMINGLLDYSRVTTRAGEFTEVDVNVVIDAVDDDLSLKLGENEGVILRDDLPTVNADEDQLNQVFQNLIKNALEHSEEPPAEIEVRGEELDDYYRFEVEDNGPGIKESRQDKVFQMFKSSKQYQTESQAKGIGLAICENIVDRHGGDIRVESEPGEGATFIFTLDKNLS
ncbi:MAG: PAS domain S-box protein [Halobacteria archaeon]